MYVKEKEFRTKSKFSLQNYAKQIKTSKEKIEADRVFLYISFLDSIGDGVHFPLLNQPEEDSLLNAQQRWMEEGELDMQEEQPNDDDDKQESSTVAIDMSPAELVHENEVETQMPCAHRAKPDVLAVQEDDIQDGTAL